MNVLASAQGGAEAAAAGVLLHAVQVGPKVGLSVVRKDGLDRRVGGATGRRGVHIDHALGKRAAGGRARAESLCVSVGASRRAPRQCLRVL